VENTTKFHRTSYWHSNCFGLPIFFSQARLKHLDVMVDDLIRETGMKGSPPRPLRWNTREMASLTAAPSALCSCQWIGLRENLQENPIFNGKIDGFL